MTVPSTPPVTPEVPTTEVAGARPGPVVVALAGVAGTGTRVLTNTLGVSSTPANRTGAMSLTLSAQFLGGAFVPLILPLYAVSPAATCAVAGAVALPGAGIASRPEPAPR